MINLETQSLQGRTGFNPAAATVAVLGLALLVFLSYLMAPAQSVLQAPEFPSVRTVYLSRELAFATEPWEVLPGPGVGVAAVAAEVAPAPSVPVALSIRPTASEVQDTGKGRPGERKATENPREVLKTTGGLPSHRAVALPDASSSGSARPSGGSAPVSSALSVAVEVRESGQPVPVAVTAPPQPVEVPQVEAPKAPLGESRAPRALNRVAPTYPPMARAQKVTGTVVVRVTVGMDGSVEDAVVEKSASPLLNQAALDAARKLKFDPALANGVPVRGNTTVPFAFSLK